MIRKYKRSLFFPSKHKRLSRIISIRTPMSFRRAIRILKRGGLTTLEKRSLILAQNRAKAILRKKNLSRKVRKRLRIISKIKVR